ncbi:hypothetical protein EOT10_03820 [Streptomyces antnestii]|uniref:Putative Flp pilus-assembly TadG-like N-terminal domain-containing protein n=1 Tax=Streptomyces antnestii TaxID=2494256 RepID=A0A437Q356_9ACTN|nr:pilus assembly protein TadG-related protein [Streptomyces sp. San01]RVU28982.1 hypothetical protein EOT10_03820 [Streptomyces sp. San01]
MRHRKQRGAAISDSGQVTAVVVVAVAGLFLFAGLVIDGGLALAGKVRAADTAQEAARAACQQVDLDYLRATHRTRLHVREAGAVARARVAAVGDTARVQVREDQVQVSVTHVQRSQVLSLVGVDRLTTTASATAHIELGTTTPWHQGTEGAP